MNIWHEIFDIKDGLLYWKISPSQKIKIGDIAGTVTNEGYVAFSYKKRRYYAHRVIFEMAYGYSPKLIDHVNCIRNDNRLENLRDVTYHQNSLNRLGTAKSGAKGVYWEARRNRWTAQIRLNGKCLYLGRFKNLEDAKVAAMAARLEQHGEYANHGNKS